MTTNYFMDSFTKGVYAGSLISKSLSEKVARRALDDLAADDAEMQAFDPLAGTGMPNAYQTYGTPLTTASGNMPPTSNVTTGIPLTTAAGNMPPSTNASSLTRNAYDTGRSTLPAQIQRNPFDTNMGPTTAIGEAPATPSAGDAPGVPGEDLLPFPSTRPPRPEGTPRSATERNNIVRDSTPGNPNPMTRSPALGIPEAGTPAAAPGEDYLPLVSTRPDRPEAPAGSERHPGGGPYPPRPGSPQVGEMPGDPNHIGSDSFRGQESLREEGPWQRGAQNNAAAIIDIIRSAEAAGLPGFQGLTAYGEGLGLNMSGIPEPTNAAFQTGSREAMTHAVQTGDFAQVESDYGLPSGFLATLYSIESGNGSDLYNESSGAAGPFQFMPATAAAYGLENPYDLAASAEATARLARDNAVKLRQTLGRDPTAEELYLAHQQGGTGASRLLSNPDALAADLVGASAIRLNGGDPDTTTAGEFAQMWFDRYNAHEPPPITNGGMPHSVFETAGMNPQAIDTFARFESLAGHTFNVNSAYRDPNHNAAVGGARGSQHMHGNAFDIDTRGMSTDERIRLIALARRAGFGGIGVYENALHVDIGPVRHWGPDYTSNTTPEWARGVLTPSQGMMV